MGYYHKASSTPASPRSSDASYIHQQEQQQRPPRTPAVPGGVKGLAPIIIPKVTSPDNAMSPSMRQISSPITPRSVPQSPRSLSDNPLVNSGGMGSAFTSRHSSRNKFDSGSPTTSDISTTAEKGDIVGAILFPAKNMRNSPSVSPRYFTKYSDGASSPIQTGASSLSSPTRASPEEDIYANTSEKK